MTRFVTADSGTEWHVCAFDEPDQPLLFGRIGIYATPAPDAEDDGAEEIHDTMDLATVEELHRHLGEAIAAAKAAKAKYED